jgi:uncharacterized membrane protein
MDAAMPSCASAPSQRPLIDAAGCDHRQVPDGRPDAGPDTTRDDVRRQDMSDPSSTEDRAEPYRESRWGAAAAVLAVVCVQIVLPSSLILGSRYLLPGVEVVLLVALVATNPTKLTAKSRDMRAGSIALLLLIGAANTLSLGLLVDSLLNGSTTSGRTLILAAIGIWLTNVVVFGLAYWELDLHGPHSRSTGVPVDPDLLFPQMTLDGPRFHNWAPKFVDYLYVSFTNSTAFSPTDTMPLTRRIKLLMLVQSLASLVTVALVGARAVNILG